MVLADNQERKQRSRTLRTGGSDICNRMRHIVAIQICNFTPFPMRDAVAFALAQPSEQAQSSTEGHSLDDTDAMRARKRNRRISASSVNTLRGNPVPDIEEDGPGHTTTGRKRATSGGSARSLGHARAGSFSGSPKMQRRTSIQAGSSNIVEEQHNDYSTFPSLSASWLDSSQKNLERVLSWRLVPTMVGLSAQSPAATSSTLTPDFLSDIHQPSTNPKFIVDRNEFPSPLTSGTTHVKLSLYAKLPAHHPVTVDVKGKGKAAEAGRLNGTGSEGWDTLQEWSIDLNELIPLPDEGPGSAAWLPFNTPVLTFISGHRCRVRHPEELGISVVDQGASSDTELDPRTIHNSPPRNRRVPPSGNKLLSVQSDENSRGNLRSSTWQDLIKLGTLQTCIVDTDQSLSELLATIHDHSLANGLANVRRIVNHQDFRLQNRQKDVALVRDACERLRHSISQRKRELQERRSTLAAASSLQRHDSDNHNDLSHRISQDREDLEALRSQLLPTRKSLVADLAYILPIELHTPADLLFTILSVPLPIPLAPSDPAPPLSLPSHRDVTEDSVATALGYAAFLVQHIAAYLGHRLVYNITYVGSRSLIKDEISAMIGPRMFPLYSKGVDTYRFEYGVFLLNKDIEMLMAERDLRALDIRHTLPNLKNLLLTLADNEDRQLRTLHRNKISISSLSSLRTVSPQPSVDIAENTPASQVTGTSESGSTDTASTIDSSSSPPTPTNGTVPSGKPKGYFGLSFFRGRYPTSVSAKPTVKAVLEASEDDTSTPTSSTISSATDVEDDTDRLTIRGVPLDSGDGVGDKMGLPTTNSHDLHRHTSKELLITVTPSSPAPPIITGA